MDQDSQNRSISELTPKALHESVIQHQVNVIDILPGKVKAREIDKDLPSGEASAVLRRLKEGGEEETNLREKRKRRIEKAKQKVVRTDKRPGQSPEPKTANLRQMSGLRKSELKALK